MAKLLLAEGLRSLRENKSITEISTAAKINPNMWALWEAGEAFPKGKDRDKINEYFVLNESSLSVNNLFIDSAIYLRNELEKLMKAYSADFNKNQLLLKELQDKISKPAIVLTSSEIKKIASLLKLPEVFLLENFFGYVKTNCEKGKVRAWRFEKGISSESLVEFLYDSDLADIDVEDFLLWEAGELNIEALNDLDVSFLNDLFEERNNFIEIKNPFKLSQNQVLTETSSINKIIPNIKLNLHPDASSRILKEEEVCSLLLDYFKNDEEGFSKLIIDLWQRQDKRVKKETVSLKKESLYSVKGKYIIGSEINGFENSYMLEARPLISSKNETVILNDFIKRARNFDIAVLATLSTSDTAEKMINNQTFIGRYFNSTWIYKNLMRVRPRATKEYLAHALETHYPH